MRGHGDLRLVVAATLVCAVGSLIVPLGPVRIVFAAPLTLVLPGYALSAAMFGSHRPERLEWLPLTLGVSLACLALGSLLLNYAPGGIGGLVWVILLVLIVLCSSAVAARRRGRARPTPNPIAGIRFTPITAILAIVSLAMATTALVLAQATVEAGNVNGFAQLWTAPPRGANGSTRIGVTSEQQQSRGFRLEIEVEDRSSPIVRFFELEPSQTRVVTLPAPRGASPVRFVARLYLRRDPTAVYRRVTGYLRGEG